MNRWLPRDKLLLVPPLSNPPLSDDLQDFIPTGMLALLAMLDLHGIPAGIFRHRHLIFEQRDLKLLAEEIRSQNCPIIGFSTWCDFYPHALLCAREIKKRDPERIIVFGGPQASLVSVETLRHFPQVDFVLKGECDQSILAMMRMICGKDLSIREVPGLVYRGADGRIMENPGPVPPARLDRLPMPRYDEIPSGASISMDIGRGCPYRCTYCSTNQFFSRKFRLKSIRRVLEEMATCHKGYGSTHFNFAHDMLTLDKDYMKSLGQSVKKYFGNHKKPVAWSCSARPDSVDEALLQSMKDSGCKGIFFGLESASPRIQKKIRKNLDLSYSERMIKKSASLGIKTAASYIIGFPDEKREDVELTLQSALRLAIEGAESQMNTLSVLPGTRIFEEHAAKLSYDGKFSGFTHSILLPEAKAMIRKHPGLFSSFYYIPSKYLDRETILSLCRLVNYLKDFKRTFLCIKEPLLKAMEKGSLLDLFQKHWSKHRELHALPEAEMSFLIRVLHEFISTLDPRTIPKCTGEVFRVDATRAVVMRKYSQMQGDDRFFQPQPSWDRIRNDSKFMVNPVWRLVETGHVIHPLYSRRTACPEPHFIRRGRQNLLVLATARDHAVVGRVRRKSLPVHYQLKDMKVEDYYRMAGTYLSEKESRTLLKKFLKHKMISLEHA